MSYSHARPETIQTPTILTEKQPLQVGQHVSTNPYNKGLGYITAIYGAQNPATVESLLGGAIMTGGTASFDIVFLSGDMTKQLPESILWGVQWEIYDQIASATEIEAAIAYHKSEAAKKEAEAQAKQTAFEAECETLRNDPEFSYLKQGADCSKEVAANIRALLKRKFPYCKFSVRKDSYSCVNIRWTDGPSKDEVEEYTRRFQAGNFNGMEDIYEYRRSPWTSVFGGVEYVFETRKYSDEVMAKYPEYEDRVKWSEPVAKPSPVSAPSEHIENQDDIHIQEHIHTKKNFTMFIIVNPKQVSRELFNQQRDQAKAYAGWYSRKWGKTPGGFAFKDRANAERFKTEVILANIE